MKKYKEKTLEKFFGRVALPGAGAKNSAALRLDLHLPKTVRGLERHITEANDWSPKDEVRTEVGHPRM